MSALYYRYSVLDAEVQDATAGLDDVIFQAGDIADDEQFSTVPKFGAARSQIRIPAGILMERADEDGKSHTLHTCNVINVWYE